MDKQAGDDSPGQRQPSPGERRDPPDAAPRALAARVKPDGSARVAEFTLSDDGQLLEAGYGHGV